MPVFPGCQGLPLPLLGRSLVRDTHTLSAPAPSTCIRPARQDLDTPAPFPQIRRSLRVKTKLVAGAGLEPALPRVYLGYCPRPGSPVCLPLHHPTKLLKISAAPQFVLFFPSQGEVCHLTAGRRPSFFRSVTCLTVMCQVFIFILMVICHLLCYNFVRLPLRVLQLSPAWADLGVNRELEGQVDAPRRLVR